MLTVAARPGAAAFAGLLLAGSLLTGPVAAPALADTASPTPTGIPAAVYGRNDPTHDGVWRQSLALTALAGAEVVPADSAVGWLTGQQCADGGWPTFRADAATACDAKAEDSNATAVAVQALTALGGHQSAAAGGVEWLRAHQNSDGSWARNPGDTAGSGNPGDTGGPGNSGNPGDANSTGLAIGALLATGIDPSTVARKGRTAYDGLAGFQLGCAAPADQRGGFAHRPTANGTLTADPLASAQAGLGAAGGKLPVTGTSTGTGTDRTDATPTPVSCSGSIEETVPRAESAAANAAYLVGQLDAHGQHLVHNTPGAAAVPDYPATSWAALALIQAGHPHQAARAADWLAGNGYAWAAKGPAGTDAAATATLLLVAEAARLDPYAFGGTNLVQLLIDAGPTPKSLPSAAISASARTPDGTRAPGAGTTGAGGNGGFSPIWLVGIGLLVGIAGGLVISRSRRRGAHQPCATTPVGEDPPAPDHPEHR